MKVVKRTRGKIMFVDLCRSTKMKTQLGNREAIPSVLEFLNIVHSSLSNGCLVKVIGDELMYFYEKNIPNDYVLSDAKNIMKALEKYNRQKGYTYKNNLKHLSCKIAICEGPISIIKGLPLFPKVDYYGRAVDRAARILGLTSSNQICCNNEFIKTLSDKNKIPETNWRWFRGWDKRQAICELGWEGKEKGIGYDERYLDIELSNNSEWKPFSSAGIQSMPSNSMKIAVSDRTLFKKGQEAGLKYSCKPGFRVRKIFITYSSNYDAECCKIIIKGGNVIVDELSDHGKCTYNSKLVKFDQEARKIEIGFKWLKKAHSQERWFFYLRNALIVCL